MRAGRPERVAGAGNRELGVLGPQAQPIAGGPEPVQHQHGGFAPATGLRRSSLTASADSAGREDRGGRGLAEAQVLTEPQIERHCDCLLNRGTTSRMITDPGPAPPSAAGEPAAAAAAVHVSGLRKRYGDVVALGGVDLVIGAGEFFTLLGPSGSGKTTLLRLIAGFERPDAGSVWLDETDVTNRPPYSRDINTVFQDYALFPHMTVAENVEYGLRVKRVPRQRRRARAAAALEMVRLGDLGE